MKHLRLFLVVLAAGLLFASTPAFALGPDESGCTAGASECNEGDCADASIGCFCAGLIAGPTGTCQRRGAAGDGCLEDGACRAGLVCPLSGPSRGVCSAPAPVEEPETPAIPETTATPTRTDYSPASFGYRNPLGSTSIPQIIGRIVRAALGIVGAIFLAVFIYGGALWMTAGGDPGKVTAAKRALLNAVIGLVVTIFSYSLLTIVFQVAGSLSGS